MTALRHALGLVLLMTFVAACSASAPDSEAPSADQAYLEDIEEYARDLGGLTTFEVASRSDMIDFGHLSCDVLDAGGTFNDVLLEVFTGYDTAADQPLTQEETVLVTIYAMTAAVDNFCPEHREALNDFLEG